MQQDTPVRMAIAGLSHDHVIWLLRNWRRKDLEILGFWEPNQALAERYAKQYALPVNLVYDDLDAMLDDTGGSSDPSNQRRYHPSL